MATFVILYWIILSLIVILILGIIKALDHHDYEDFGPLSMDSLEKLFPDSTNKELDNGVVISILDNKLEAFLKSLRSSEMKIFDGLVISSTMKLCKDGSKLMMFQDNKLCLMKMR